jgi:hypothetical protein
MVELLMHVLINHLGSLMKEEEIYKPHKHIRTEMKHKQQQTITPM